MSQKVMIATPVNEPKLVIGYVQSLLSSQIALRQAGIRSEILFETQCSLVVMGRNNLVTDFLASNATDLVFIDSDIGWKPESLVRLLQHDVSLVAGIYRKKAPETIYTVEFDDPRNIAADPKTGLLKAKGVSAGFLRIRRDCIEAMIKAYPELKITERKQEQYALFDTMIENGKMVGEDYTFCRRWAAIGGTIWVDPTIDLDHYGMSAYTGSLTSSLQKKQAD
ncbi:hypothetical protein [Microvirga solisilvae]|uniref:hypothetical protein n=1 Tax=Microvirga solisilvae TaxID=2919498 RepID=UPI001FAF9773|nr:hypothetical protein [Microvirga solisilvae]